MINIFGKDGILKEFHKNFDFREQQVSIADFVMERLASGEHGIVEAGTGIGKTLSYLVPVMVYAHEQKKKAAVSTETKALQNQIIEKDIPTAIAVVREHCGYEPTFAVCFGSSNYPCRRRFELLRSMGRFSAGDKDIIEELQAQFNKKRPFTRFDFSIPAMIWNEICREPDACQYNNCPDYGSCIFQTARRAWSDADLLIMNHHLFFSNIASGRLYLPPIDIIVFDEAHSLEDIASEQLGFDVSSAALAELISKFYRKESKNSFVNSISDVALRKKTVSALNQLPVQIQSFYEQVRERALHKQLVQRITGPLGFGDEVIDEVKELFNLFADIEKLITDDSLKIQFDLFRARLLNMLQHIASFVHHDRPNYVYWIECENRDGELLGDVHLRGQPIDISEIMAEEVNGFYESAFYFSATLAVNGDFRYFEKRLGMSRHASLLLSSPFDYKNQVMLYLDRSAAEPSDPGYLQNAARTAIALIREIGGNCLLLFTSYRMMHEMRELLAERIDNPLYVQGDRAINELLRHYAADDGPVLLGTHSFWQGIDLPGDLLKGVIMMRLPFIVPDRPSVQAKMEKLEEIGENPFYGYQVPSAIIKFKQGFGRLIRTPYDRGIVAVLDPRIVSKSYGKLFLHSVPECTVIHTLEQAKKFIESWDAADAD